jgi:VanZ family protein
VERNQLLLENRVLVREYWVPLLTWVSLTYLFSSDAFSAGETSSLIVPILSFLLPGVSDEQILFVHGAIRKLGHVSEFFVMAVLTSRAVSIVNWGARAVLVSGAFVLSAAALDELHQMLTMYRGASPVDVGYDCLGGMIGIWLFGEIRRRRELARMVSV